MAKSNVERVGDIMQALKMGLGPFVLREYKQVYKGKRYLAEVSDALTTGAYAPPTFHDDQEALESIDIQGWLNLMSRRWNDVFRQKLGRSERAYVNELQDARNAWAHQQPFTVEDARRVADTATLLLKAANLPKHAEYTQKVMRALQRIQFEAEQKRVQKKPTSPDGVPTTTQKGLRPWRFVIEPHPDVASGRYVQAEFTADLGQVHSGTAEPEYQEPVEFFRRTYLTEGLVTLLANGVRRLDGQGGDPVVQLQTAFGGGKTHSMLALYHLFSGNIGISKIPGGELILEKTGEIDDTIHANRAVIVGTAFDANTPRQYADVTTHTLWGEIAYQLGGAAGYKLMDAADLSGAAPGSDTIVKLLEAHGPALIIIDELIAFARVLYNSGRTPAGSFESIMTFMQSLTEGVRRSSDSLLLVSIPESEIEVGGEGGKAALDILSNTIGRIESVWKPVTATESFEIVRRRLFNSEIDYAARDGVIAAFQKMYAEGKGEYPTGVAEGPYLARMKAAYPIHPELFDRLYQDWSTLDRFQRTRGVLRLMAAVIHQLWFQGDQSLMIMPASIPLAAATVRDEILKYLPETWPAIVDIDIDGDGSRPHAIDKNVPTLSRYSASRRVARSIFMGSAPSVAAQAVRGVESVRINLATVQPGEPVATFGDALRRLSNELTYLYSDGSRYWYDTHPTVNRMAQDRVPNISADLIYAETQKRLKAVKLNKADFNAAHIMPSNGADVVDEGRTRVVVLAPEEWHKRNSGETLALRLAEEILESRGNAPRLYRNMLVFIAADGNSTDALDLALREYLAWKSIQEEQEELNLDPQQQKQVQSNLKRTDETLTNRLQEAYSWLIVPGQSDPTGPIQWQAHRINGPDSFYARAMRKLRQSELLIIEWSPVLLTMELDAYLWREEEQLGIKKLWEYLSRYCYLSRLYDQQVLVDAIFAGVQREDAPFAYADRVDEQGRYHGLTLGEMTTIYFNDESVIVRPTAAQAQIAADAAKAAKVTIGSTYQSGVGTGHPVREGNGTGDTAPDTTPTPAEVVALMRRYYGAVTIDPQRVNREIGTIVEEIIERFTSIAGTEVELTLEIKARHEDGFSEAIVRTVNENSRTLKFHDFDFEDE